MQKEIEAKNKQEKYTLEDADYLLITALRELANQVGRLADK